jgi:hypothetical protein
LKRSHIRFTGQNRSNPICQEEYQAAAAAKNNSLFEQKLELVTEGLEPYSLVHLKTKITPDNSLTILEYILSVRTETSLSNNKIDSGFAVWP